MREGKNQIPIIEFLKKHKWRIIIPVLIVMFYISIPQFVRSDATAVQQNLFIKSAILDPDELVRAVKLEINFVNSDEFLESLITKYDLFPADRNNRKKQIEKFRQSIDIRLEDEDLVEGVGVFVWIHFRGKENEKSITQVSNDIALRFEQKQNWQVNKYVTKPYNASGVNRYFQFVANIFVSMLMFSVPLILIWEIPNLFYSRKTKQMIFEPLLADWEEELTEARLRNDKWKAFQTNVRYSIAFLAAIIQKSPLGDLLEFIGKIAK